MGVAFAGSDLRPPVEGFITVDGIRLHYHERGTGVPVVLLHGNGSMIGDFVSSGIIERVATSHRVIVFDRPGFGHSERPRNRKWGPSEQGKLLLRAFELLGIRHPIVVGHSWGTLVALALTLEAPEKVAGLVLLSGYYYPAAKSHPTAGARTPFPLMNEMLLNAFMPFIGHYMALSALRIIFAPCIIPERFKRHYSIRLALRPSQMKAVAEEAEMLSDSAQTLSRHYRELDVPVHLVAGADDRIVETDKHSVRLNRELSTSTFRNVRGVGHMVHHAAPDEVVSAISGMCGCRRIEGPARPSTRTEPRQRAGFHRTAGGGHYERAFS